MLQKSKSLVHFCSQPYFNFKKCSNSTQVEAHLAVPDHSDAKNKRETLLGGSLQENEQPIRPEQVKRVSTIATMYQQD